MRTFWLIIFQELVADFLFVLCKENVNRLIKYTGYGNAAGLLASRGLMGGGQSQGNGGDYSSDDEDSETEEYAMDKSQIDPMIGEYTTPSLQKVLTIKIQGHSQVVF